MRAVKNRRVKSTELALRARLAAAGISGWRMYDFELPGTPDFVFPAARVAIYVDGCFWHGCPRCYRRPHSSQAYWDQKVSLNRCRDARVNRAMRRLGWIVRHIWEHDLRRPGRAVAIVNNVLSSRGDARGTPRSKRPDRTRMTSYLEYENLLAGSFQHRPSLASGHYERNLGTSEGERPSY